MEYKLLKEIATITMGQSPESSSYNEEQDGLPFFQGNADFGELYPTERVWCNAPKKMAHSGDILISVRAPIGALNIAKSKCCIGRGLAAISTNNEEDRNYIFHLLRAKNDKLNQQGTGSTFKAIGRKILEEIEVPIISLDEQKLSVQLLDLVEKNIKKRQSELDQLDNLIKARFVELFGDPIENTRGWNLVELGELTGIGSSKRIFEKEYVTDGVPFYRTKEIVELSKGNSISTELYITRERFSEIKGMYGVPEAGDLLITAVGTIGVIWIVDGKNDFYFKDGNIIRVHGSKRFNSVYMKNLLENLIAEHKRKMSFGTAYAALTITDLKKFKIYDIPMDVQNKFADFVQQVDKSKAVVQEALDKAQLLFDSLMQKYFG
jgi:type I restriction enzyme S subunit